MRLIDANDAEKFVMEHILDAKERYLILDFLKECSTVDAVEVVHGRWIRYPHGSGIYCSECKHKRRYKDEQDNYCPNCGAKMDGGDDDG